MTTFINRRPRHHAGHDASKLSTAQFLDGGHGTGRNWLTKLSQIFSPSAARSGKDCAHGERLRHLSKLCGRAWRLKLQARRLRPRQNSFSREMLSAAWHLLASKTVSWDKAGLYETIMFVLRTEDTATLWLKSDEEPVWVPHTRWDIYVIKLDKQSDFFSNYPV